MEDKRFIKELKKMNPSSARFKNSNERLDASDKWEKYHQYLDETFSNIKTSKVTEKISIFDQNGNILLVFNPHLWNEVSDDLKLSYREAEKKILNFTPQTMGFYPTHNRRHSKEMPCSWHMGFYEQNLPGCPLRTWKLYEKTDKDFLLLLKPLLQHISRQVLSIWPSGKDLPCPPQYGLFGTIFTTLALNIDACEWHVDPMDHFAVLLYFGNFKDGSFCVGPPLNLEMKVTSMSFLVVNSSLLFHKALPFTGKRINISVYAKKTTPITPKGTLTTGDKEKWALEI
jgi:hypothetical protein